MGYAFDDNGKYINWSNLFDYSDERTLKASEYLPIPDGTIFLKGSSSYYNDYKEVIDYLFDTNPELSKIGSKEEYAAYIASIYPDSEIQDVYWHGTNADFSNGFKTATRTIGSGAPETATRNDFYFNRLPWASLQYVNGINRNIPDSKGFQHWNKLWWELKEILGNGRKADEDWKNEVIGPNVRLEIPNKKGVFNRVSTQIKGNGSYLSERKANYGYENKSDKEFFEEVFGIKFGEDTFNTWVNRNKKVFELIFQQRENITGLYPAVIKSYNPIIEDGLDTYYQENRKLFTKASRGNNDAIVSMKAKNEFGSDVVIAINANEDTVHWLGTLDDVSSFKLWKDSKPVVLPKGLDITKQLKSIFTAHDQASKIKEEAKLLRQLQEANKTYKKGKKYIYLSWDPEIPKDFAEAILFDLNKHSQTLISPTKILLCLKNSISSSITNIILDIRNMDMAYSPILMNTVRKPADESPKGNKATKMTLINPLTKFLMLEANMTGKGVIGVVAVGEKVFFNTSHYWNEGIRSGDEEWIKNLQFSRTFERILGRSIDNITPVTRTRLTNVNFEDFEEIQLKFIKYDPYDQQLRIKYGITDEDISAKNDKWKAYSSELLQYIRSQQESDIYADDLISQLLSAATDNAKELILYRINASMDLTRCYIHLIMMGFDINDIVKFMTCPAVSLIDNLSSANMFDEYISKISIKEVVNLLRGNIPVEKFLYGSYNASTSVLLEAFNEIHRNLLEELLKAGFVQASKTKKSEDGTPVMEPKLYKYMSVILRDYWQCRLDGRINESLKSFMRRGSSKGRINYNLIALSDYIDKVIAKIKSSGPVNEFMLDVEEFSKVYELASETSTLGSAFLKFNQGIPTAEEDIINVLLTLNLAMSSREKIFGITRSLSFPNADAYGIFKARLQAENPFLTDKDIDNTLEEAMNDGLVGNFDFVKWLFDEDGYRKKVSRYYNIIKGTWNIFDIVDKLPHYNKIFENFKAVITFDRAMIKKSRMLNLICNDLFLDAEYIDPNSIKGLLDYADDLIVLNWLNQKQFEFPMFKGDTLFKFNWSLEKNNRVAPIILKDEVHRGMFKKAFEERLLPHLRAGFFKDIVDGLEVIKNIDKNNKFILNLIFDVDDDGRTFLRLDLDMLNTNATASTEGRYQECLSDFIKLKNAELYGLPLTDWFMIYNICINKNKYGSDRLTTLFGQFIGMIKEPSVIKELLTFTGQLDFNLAPDIYSLDDLNEFGYNRDDALYKIAPFISVNLEINSSAELVKEKRDGRMIVKRKPKGLRNYSNSEEIIPDSSNSAIAYNDSEIDKLQRLRNYIKYSTITTPFASKLTVDITNLQSDDWKLILNALLNYTKKDIIRIYTDNC